MNWPDDYLSTPGMKPIVKWGWLVGWIVGRNSFFKAKIFELFCILCLKTLVGYYWNFFCECPKQWHDMIHQRDEAFRKNVFFHLTAKHEKNFLGFDKSPLGHSSFETCVLKRIILFSSPFLIFPNQVGCKEKRLTSC